MAGPMSVSMILRLVDEVSGPVRGIVDALNGLNGAASRLNQTTASNTSASAFAAEKQAVAEVTAEVGKLQAATAEAAVPISQAVSRLNDEKAAVASVTAAMRDLGAATAAARQRGGPIDLGPGVGEPGGPSPYRPRLGPGGRSASEILGDYAAQRGAAGPGSMADFEAWRRGERPPTPEPEPRPPEPEPKPRPPAPVPAGGMVDTMMGMAEIASGYSLLKGTYEQSADALSRNTSMQVAGFTQSEIARLNAASLEVSQRARIFSQNQIAEFAQDARSILGSTDHAIEALPDIASLATIAEAKRPGQGGEGIMQLLKGMETSGRTQDYEHFHHMANSLAKVTNVYGKTIDFGAWGQFFKYAGTAGAHLSDEFIEQKLPHLIQELGGASTGTMIQTMERATIGGRMDKAAVEKMLEYGLLDPEKVHKEGGHYKMDAGALRHGDVALRDPSLYATQYVDPVLKARGLSPDEEQHEMETMYSNRLSARGMMLMTTQDALVQKTAAQIRNAQGLEAAPVLAANDPHLASLAREAQTKNLEQQAGAPVMPMLTRAQNLLTTSITNVANALEKIPGAATGVVAGVAGGASYLGWKTLERGAWNSIRMFGRLPGLGVAGEAAGAAAVGEGAAAGGGAAATAATAGGAAALGTAIGTAAGATIVAGAGAAVMAGSIYGIRNASPDLGYRGRAEPPSQRDTDLSGHWASSRFGLRQWVLDAPGAARPGGSEGPALSTAQVQAIVAPLASAMTQAMAGARERLAAPLGVAATGPKEPSVQTNNNQKYISAPVTVNAPVTINATVQNTTPAAIGASVGGAIGRAVKAGSTAAFHDGHETR